MQVGHITKIKDGQEIGQKVSDLVEFQLGVKKNWG